MRAGEGGRHAWPNLCPSIFADVWWMPLNVVFRAARRGERQIVSPLNRHRPPEASEKEPLCARNEDLMDPITANCHARVDPRLALPG